MEYRQTAGGRASGGLHFSTRSRRARLLLNYERTTVVGVLSHASCVIAIIDGTSMMPMLPQVNSA